MRKLAKVTSELTEINTMKVCVRIYIHTYIHIYIYMFVLTVLQILSLKNEFKAIRFMYNYS